MTIDKMKVKFLGKTAIVFRVFVKGELVHVFDTEAEAQAWIAAQ